MPEATLLGGSGGMLDVRAGEEHEEAFISSPDNWMRT